MNKRQFLKELQEELSYELPDLLIRNNVEYYSSYIDSEMAKGRSEKEVLEDLGDPRLIARSIIDAAKSGSDGISNTADDRDYSGQIYGGSSDRYGAGDAYGGSGSYGNGSGAGGGFRDSDSRSSYGSDLNGDRQKHRKDIHVSYYNFGCLGFLIVLLVLSAIFSLVGTAVTFLMPILGPIIIVCILLWLFNNFRGDQ